MNLKIKKITKKKSVDTKNLSPKPKKKSLRESLPIKAQGEDRYYKQVDESSFGMSDILIYFYEKYEGDWDDIYKAI